jgi:hypothetical protein
MTVGYDGTVDVREFARSSNMNSFSPSGYEVFEMFEKILQY